VGSDDTAVAGWYRRTQHDWACLDDLGEVFLARVEGGKFRFYSRQDLEVPQGTIAPRDRANRKTAGEK